MDTALYVLAALMVLIGLAGIILPILPGVVLVFAGMFLAAWVGDFVAVGPWTVGILAGLTLLSLLVDLLASVAGAQRVNASRQALLGAFLGSLRSEEHTSELQSLLRISYAVLCLKKKKKHSQRRNSYINRLKSNHYMVVC